VIPRRARGIAARGRCANRIRAGANPDRESPARPMDIPLSPRWFARRKRAELRRLLRGYGRMVGEEGIGHLRGLRNGLVDVAIGRIGQVSTGFFGAGAGSAERIVRQFLLERYAGPMLNHAILRSRGDARRPIAHAMPGPWREYLRESGLRVDDVRSSLAWQLAVLKRLANGIYWLVRLAVRNGAPGKPLPHRYAYFDGLKASNLPQCAAPSQSYDICSCYLRWGGRRERVETVCHGVEGATAPAVDGVAIRYLPPPFELPAGPRKSLRLLAWGAGAIARATASLLRGHWWYALLLAEAVKARAVRICAPETLAAEYLFHSSGTIYRPMWTYEAERHGACVSLYFYSTYDQPKLATGYQSQSFEWGPANWPLYVVWDACQADMLRNDLGAAANIEQAGPIYFTDSAAPLPEIPARAVAVFDVQPHRKSAHFGIATMSEHLAAHPDVHLRFLEDVRQAIDRFGGTMVLKAKRDIGRRGEKRYRAPVDRISGMRGVCIVDPDISAMRVSAACVAGVSFPFTSTALYLRALGLPSAYYDPSGWIQKDDRGAHGIPILSGRAELWQWLESVARGPAGPTPGVPVPDA
jgi:polysaccharide biosynthesis PFTS motif protein